jgi:hypothetical protein
VVAVSGAPPIRVTIDRLVLHGIDRADSAAVERALVAELGAALAGAQPAGGGSDRIRLDLAAAEPGALGASAGRAIGGALAGRGPRP